ncbi:MAG: sigma 54-interacting transcriptional regulator [Syntrophomonadaceae bacterium]
MPILEIRERWKQLHADPALRNTLRPEIRDSWERCYASGVDRYLRENSYILTQTELREHQDKVRGLMETSSSVMHGLYQFVSDTGFVVALSDADLCVVKVIGDAEALEFAHKANLREGALWSEHLVGTNAGSLAVALNRPISVYGYEHFCLFSQVAAGSCAPIIDQGKILGCLGMIAPYNRLTNHTLGMVVASTKHIKYRMAAERVKSYHSALMNSIQEGLFAIDVNGDITYMNENCARFFKLPPELAMGRNIADLLGHNEKNHYFIQKIMSGRRTIDENFTLSFNNETFHFNITCNPLKSPPSHNGAVVLIQESQRIKRLVRNFIGGEAKITFDNIVGQNPDFRRSLRTAEVAASSDSNILLLGESGTGKDIFAQAMHNASPRRNNPYLAINCAALPRELIASELFGYEDGAFTGARKGGNMGKFELADQGTIFLDEIGDMPLDLQASLLRVLEERSVMRLGGSKQIPINVRIIAATNQNLELMMEENRFRRDLYYRLGVIRINIPALRNRRDDILLLADYFIRKICDRLNRPVMTLAPEVVEAFKNYEWRGNIREMQNLLEGAIQLSAGQVITQDMIGGFFMPKAQPASPAPVTDSTVQDLEKQMILDYLEKYKYNKSKVATALGISRRTLYRRLADFNIGE